MLKKVLALDLVSVRRLKRGIFKFDSEFAAIVFRFAVDVEMGLP